MKAEQLLNDLGLTMGIKGLMFDDQGCASLVFDQKYTINLELNASTEQLHLYSDLGALPGQDREQLYLKLLNGNLFHAETGGATLAVDSVQQQVVLCRVLNPEPLSGKDFCNIIEAFVNAVAQWQDKINELPASTPKTSIADLDIRSMQGLIRG